MDENGRITIPAVIRRQLDVENTAADVRLSIEVLETYD